MFKDDHRVHHKVSTGGVGELVQTSMATSIIIFPAIPVNMRSYQVAFHNDRRNLRCLGKAHADKKCKHSSCYYEFLSRYVKHEPKQLAKFHASQSPAKGEKKVGRARRKNNST